MAKFAVIIYSTYGHIYQMAEAVKAGIEASGNQADILQVPETLNDTVLELIHAPPKKDYPIATTDLITQYDGYVFGYPTRYGSAPSQINSFLDATGGLWASGALYHKPAGMFVSSAGSGSQENTTRSMLSFLAHHGMVYVPLGFKATFADLANVEEIHGGSAWGAGCLAGGDGSRQPSELELRVATAQGSEFGAVAAKLVAVAPAAPVTTTAPVETPAPTAAVEASAAAEQKAAEAADKTATAETTTVSPTPAAAKVEKESSSCCIIV